MKEMIYSAEGKKEVLFSGEYKRHKFCILNLGWHPTAYVECKIDIQGYHDAKLDDILVHGGFTYYATPHWENDPCLYLGWDYGHCFDYAGFYVKYPSYNDHNYKKWTTSEIFEEVKKVIEQLITLEESENAE